MFQLNKAVAVEQLLPFRSKTLLAPFNFCQNTCNRFKCTDKQREAHCNHTCSSIRSDYDFGYITLDGRQKTVIVEGLHTNRIISL